ncbi:thioesterase II family protein [Actinosynnema sp. NPDC059335]|uniref:thioesterase II family protein n=1 Tax=Actinosynnema sp. NPDC059335 TaxID=3346804 RepID=UPI00366B1237
MNELWWHVPQRRPDAAFRLFCLPYAGGGAAAFREWSTRAPGHVEVRAVELPGRGRRLSEAPHTRVRPLVANLAEALLPALDRPFALFGHSMGALVAFELTRRLRSLGQPMPRRLFVSGASAPSVPRTRPVLHAASDADLVRELRLLNGTPPQLLTNDELMALTLPTLRADFSVLETYEHRPEAPLPVPITVFAGSDDPSVPYSSLPAWRTHSDRDVRLRVLPGDHFFVHSATAEILAEIGAALTPGIPRPGRRPA